MKAKILIFAIFVCSLGFAQNYKGKLNEVSETGFYEILLSPQVRSATQDNTDYFRIIDAAQNEVPYVFVSKTAQIERTFESLEIIAKNTIKDSITTLIIKNYQQENNGELVFTVSNTEINKYYSISGSNDQRDWFGLASNRLLNNLNAQQGNTTNKTILFPSNTYQ
ncbi:hypothetical protein [Flavobacterium sp.]